VKTPQTLAILEGLPKKKDAKYVSNVGKAFKVCQREKTKKAALSSSLFISIMKYLS
jgi:hypothetical protein